MDRRTILTSRAGENYYLQHLRGNLVRRSQSATACFRVIQLGARAIVELFSDLHCWASLNGLPPERSGLFCSVCFRKRARTYLFLPTRLHTRCSSRLWALDWHCCGASPFARPLYQPPASLSSRVGHRFCYFSFNYSKTNAISTI